MYKEYLAEFWYLAKTLENSKVSFSVPTGGIYGEVGVNTFRNVIGAYYLPRSREYVAPPSINIVRPWFETIGYGETVPCLGGKTRGFDQITNKDVIILYNLANGINIDYANIFWEDIIIKLNKRHREKVVPYTRFLSLLMMHNMKEGYGDGEVTPYTTQVFSVNNWALNPNQPEEPLFTDHMLTICNSAEPVHSTSSKQPSVSSKKTTKGGSSKAPTSSKTGPSKKRKESSSAIDSNPSQPIVSTLVDTRMHKEDQQATSGPTSLWVTTSFIVHSESASGCDASADSIAEADPGLFAPNDSIPQQQGMDEGTKNTSFNHISVSTDPYVLADQTKSISKGLEIVLTQPITGKGASSIARQIEEESSRTIKLEDLAKLVLNVQISFKDLDSPEDDPIIVVDDSDEDKSSQIQELTNQVLILQSQKHKLELEKNKAEAKVALLKAQPSFPNVEQLNELLVKSLQTEFSKILSAHDFSSSLPTKLKDLPSKFNELTKEEKGLKKQVHELEIELPGDLKEIPTKLEDFTKTITNLTSQVVELKTLYSSQPEGEHIKKYKGKKAVSSEEAEKESTNIDSNDDDETHLTGSKLIIAESRITNCDVLTKKVTLKVYREDGTSEVIPNFKASDPHLGEWREVVKACPNRIGKGWKTIYGQIQTRIDYLHTIEVELGINLDIPLSEQDPLEKLNDLAKKKRKHADDIHDYFKANKRLKPSVQYEDHLPGTMLNEPVLEIFRRHQGPGLDDHARTFSSLLLVEVDKRNLNPLRQMRVIEQLRDCWVQVPEVISLSLDLNIKSPKYTQAEDGTKTKKVFGKSFSSAWLTILSCTLSISLTED
ncbi:hypothetical protein Tco_1156900 [Tanacetum coccineum]